MSGSKKLRFGLWYDFRNPPRWRRKDSEIYSACFDQIVRAENLGFDDIWLSEHHFLADSYSPSMLAIGCAIAAKTKKVDIGTSVLLLPLHDPVRVAEDAATLDVISGGRLQLGLGVGYKVEELKAWGVDPKSRGKRMDEGIEIIQRLFAGERFSFEGQYHRYEDIKLSPMPVQKKPRLWIAGFSNVAVKRAARVGAGYIAIGPVGPFTQVYRDTIAENGRDPSSGEVAAGYAWLHVSRNPEQRWKEAVEHLAYQQNEYGKWFSAAGMDFIQKVEPTKESIEQNECYIVTPDKAIEMIEKYVKATGCERFYTWAVPPGLHPSWSDEHIELMASEVIPAFR
jgi:probable F420-dependent oxidoreductase